MRVASPTISVYIPCIPEHLGRLSIALSVLARSSVPPDQLIVFLSGAESLTPTQLNGAYGLVQKYGGELEVEQVRLSPGAARIPSRELCKSEVIAYQDADDFTHERRLEVMGSAFTDAEAMHVFTDMTRVRRGTFGWVARRLAARSLGPYQVVDGRYLYERYFPTGELKRPDGMWVFGEDAGFGFGLGVFGVRRELLDVVQWRSQEDLRLIPEDFTNAPFLPWWQGEGRTPHGFEDSEFCFESLFYVNQMRFISAPLYFYCNNLRWRDEKIYQARSRVGRILGRD